MRQEDMSDIPYALSRSIGVHLLCLLVFYRLENIAGSFFQDIEVCRHGIALTEASLA